MKKVILTSLFCVLLFFGCHSVMNEGSKEEDPVNRVIGRWKLNEISIIKDEQRPAEIVDYSGKNIIYEFQEGHKLVVIGNAGDLFIFDDFTEGEHFYEYSELNVCPTCLPGPNLFIDEPPLGQADGRYYCIVDLDNQTMSIVGDKVIRGVVDETGLSTGINSYHWGKTFIKIDDTTISACGVTDPAKNLPWLAELIETAKTDNTGHYLGRIWLEKFKGQEIFVTDMMLGSGGIAYWFFDCSGNHLISQTWEYETCPACNFVGNNHFFIEDEDFQHFILNMKLDVIIYSPF